jgi:hypothetical protein
MRKTLTVALAGLLLSAAAAGQKLELKFDSLAAKAAEKSDVDLDGGALSVAHRAGKLGHGMPATVTGVHVRNYEFSNPDEYSEKDLEPLRKQVGAGSGWTRIIHAKEKHESTEIFLHSQGDQIRGLLILSCEAKEVSVVYITGTLTPDNVNELVKSHGNLVN